MNDDVKSAPADLAAVDVEAAEALEDRLPLVVTVGFTGHRASRTRAGRGAKMRAVFDDIGARSMIVAASPRRRLRRDRRLRLTDRRGAGADRAAAAVWTAARASARSTAIYPFKAREGATRPTPIIPTATTSATRVAGRRRVRRRCTGIDASGLGPRRAPAHAEVGRWIVRNSRRAGRLVERQAGAAAPAAPTTPWRGRWSGACRWSGWTPTRPRCA